MPRYRNICDNTRYAALKFKNASMNPNLKSYLLVTGGYWGFTITDGAIRMLVVLYFYQLGYTPLTIASLFLFYEFFGIVTNLVGGWLGARVGLNFTMYAGMLLQILALSMLAIDETWLSVPYVMLAQAISGIAKDLNKMSAKASIKLFVPEGGSTHLFKWIAILTGSKNTLKGAGFFIGGLLLALAGFQGALWILASSLALVMVVVWILLPRDLGKSPGKPKFTQVFSNTPAINWLSAARFFLFGSRDVWFVVALPVFLSSTLQWSHTDVGSFMALWVIGYGIIQAFAPRLVRHSHHGGGPDGATVLTWNFVLLLVPLVIAYLLQMAITPAISLVFGLCIFAVVFAINSSVHSYLVVAWSEREKVSMNVGFYYMANAGGRLVGTILSGVTYQQWGLQGSLFASSIFVLFSLILSIPLPRQKKPL